MELAIAGKEDSGNYPLEASRRMLSQHQRAWADLQWTKELLVRATNVHWLLVGGVLSQISEDKSTIHFKRLPSQSRNIEERDWTVDVGRFDLIDRLLDPSQDLLVVIAQPDRSVFYNAAVRLFERSITDGMMTPFIESIY